MGGTLVETPRGTASVDLTRPRRAVGLLALGHGASGRVDAPDLVAVRDAAVAAGIAVAVVRQPYAVAGRPLPPAAAALDEAWLTVLASLRVRLPLIVGGRSSGARVACRTARSAGAVAVLALAFPLHPPGRPERTREGELDPMMPTLVINGTADPYGVPSASGQIMVVTRVGEGHDLRRDPAGVASLAVEWLLRSLRPA